MDKNEIYKAIDDLVWFIPIKKLRDSIRVLLKYQLDRDEKLNKLHLLLQFMFNELETINNNDNEIIIIPMDGGFTDQIFHYVVGKYIELKFNKKVEYQYSYEDQSSRRFILLDIFPDLDIKLANKRDIYKYSICSNYYLMPIDEEKLENFILKIKRMYFNGYFREVTFYNRYRELFDSILDFDKYIYPRLDNKNLEIYNKIVAESCPIAIHLRLGDLENKFKDNINSDYIITAIDILSNELKNTKFKFFIFSNNIDYVKNNIIDRRFDNYDYEFINNDEYSGYVDFYLITKCNHVIASVGRFGYAAYNFIKNNHKILILPFSFFNKDEIYKYSIPDFQSSGNYDISNNDMAYIIKYKKN